MSTEKVRKLLKEKSAKGKFTAAVNGIPFLDSDFVNFGDWRKSYAVIGSENNNDWITFSIPTALIGNGPHKVKHDSSDDALVWEVLINNVSNRVTSGVVTVTFKDQQRKAIYGRVDLELGGGGRNVTGKFDIWT
jgi:hypothetical protein